MRKAGRKQECMQEGKRVRRQGSRTIGKEDRGEEGCAEGRHNARQVTHMSSGGSEY